MCFTHEVLGWVKHISSEIPGYNNWKEIYDFTFDALNAPDAVPGSDETHIGTEADLVADFQNPELESEYACWTRKPRRKTLQITLALSERHVAARISSTPLPPATPLLI